MNGMGVVNAIYAALDRCRTNLRRGVVAAAIFLMGAAVLFCAAGFALAGAYMWLSTQLPAHQAALVIAAALVLAAAVIFAVAARRSSPPLGRQEHTATLAEQAETATDRAAEEAMAQIRRSPAGSLAVALAAGVVLGLLRPRD